MSSIDFDTAFAFQQENAALCASLIEYYAARSASLINNSSHAYRASRPRSRSRQIVIDSSDSDDNSDNSDDSEMQALVRDRSRSRSRQSRQSRRNSPTIGARRSRGGRGRSTTNNSAASTASRSTDDEAFRIRSQNSASSRGGATGGRSSSAPTVSTTSYPSVDFSASQTYTQEPCSVCMEDFVQGAKTTRLPCMHLFHTDCVTEWIDENHTCPVCRTHC